MENISTVSGKLLFFARQLHQNKTITLKEMGTLKDLIVSQNQDILNQYEKYVKQGTQLTLTTALVRLAYQQKDNETDEGSSQGSSRKIKNRGFKIIIPTRNIQKLHGAQERL